jgi:DNA invertase Pin-like site-specific DNA recombinase
LSRRVIQQQKCACATIAPSRSSRRRILILIVAAPSSRSSRDIRSITEAIDTTTPGGRLVFHLFGALGQFERDLIRERTRAGLAAAAARGRKGGRKPVIDADKLGRARSMIARGLTVREAAARLRGGKTALYEALRLRASEITLAQANASSAI